MKNKCTKCKKEKEEKEFPKDKRSKNGLSSWCKKCTNIAIKKYGRTKKGLSTNIYKHQKGSSKERQHKPPKYTKKELNSWLFKSPKFHKLYNDWVRSGYKTNLIPSIDRIDDYKCYSLDNIQLMTWGENRRQPRGVYKQRKLRKVMQYDKKGNFIREFQSIWQAQQQIGTTHIYENCKGIRKSAGGYKWKYKT